MPPLLLVPTPLQYLNRLDFLNLALLVGAGTLLHGKGCRAASVIMCLGWMLGLFWGGGREVPQLAGMGAGALAGYLLAR